MPAPFKCATPPKARPGIPHRNPTEHRHRAPRPPRTPERPRPGPRSPTPRTEDRHTEGTPPVGGARSASPGGAVSPRYAPGRNPHHLGRTARTAAGSRLRTDTRHLLAGGIRSPCLRESGGCGSTAQGHPVDRAGRSDRGADTRSSRTQADPNRGRRNAGILVDHHTKFPNGHQEAAARRVPQDRSPGQASRGFAVPWRTPIGTARGDGRLRSHRPHRAMTARA